MESELSPDKEKHIPRVPIKTYQWEDLRRARDAGGYPWTHLLKAPLEGEITAEDIIRETTPRRSMSREFSRSRTRSPVDGDVQKILNLDSSPGSSRKHTEEGEDGGVHIPNFSTEVSCEYEDDALKEAVKSYIVQRPESQSSSHLTAPTETPRNISPKSILKRRSPDHQYIVTETREKTKCCHPLVNKIKHLADKTLHKFEGKENEKSPSAKRKKNEELQEIRQLNSSPSVGRRQKFSAIKLGDSDDMSKTDTPTLRKKKEHIYEDIDDKNDQPNKSADKIEHDNKSNTDKEVGNWAEKKSIASQDPSLVVEDTISLRESEHVMEHLHHVKDINKEATLLDDEADPDEPNVDEIFQNQLDESRVNNDCSNVTITEIVDEYLETNEEEAIIIPIETSPTPSPREMERKITGSDAKSHDWSKPSSDHEYEIIEKPAHNITYSPSNVYDKTSTAKTDDELSSNTSLAKNLSSESNKMEQYLINNSEDVTRAESLQRDIEERYFSNTPSTVSRTDCEISTSQVDSSALENLPLKRDSRSKNVEHIENKIQQRLREGTGKLKTQAGKLKTKLQNIKTKQFTMPERPKFNFPERSKIKLPERPRFTLPERPKFTLPDKRKFSLPDRPKFKKINISEKLTFGDRKKFTLPERPRFNVPDLPNFKISERTKLSFPRMNRKKEGESSSSKKPDTGVKFEAKTYPRLFSKKKKTELPKTSSSPTLNREDTPPPIFTFTRVKKTIKTTSSSPQNLEQPREYGDLDNQLNYEEYMEGTKQFETTYDFDNLETRAKEADDNENSLSTPDISPTKQKYTHINEINNDEFFVRPRGISRENIQVREYLSDEIRQAFKIPQNVLASMGSNSGINDEFKYDDEPEADPELFMDENEPTQYSLEDPNDKDDGYYTFPPVRPSRSKPKKKSTETSFQYIDDSVDPSMHFSEVDLELCVDQDYHGDVNKKNVQTTEQTMFSPGVDLHSIHEYANDDILEYPVNVTMTPQTLPMPPKRKKKSHKDLKHSSLNNFKNISSPELWDQTREETDDIIVYRTEHEYIVPGATTEQSPLPPRRNRSRSSRGTSLCDDDRTSHGAESLTLDPHVSQTEYMDRTRHESPGYATVEKTIRRSDSKTPPVRRRKSSSSERKYYTVGSNKTVMPNRPPRKKSSSSLMTLDRYKKQSISADLTQYVEIDDPHPTESHKDLNSGIILSKMRDRPLPPPPRPPRGSKREKSKKNYDSKSYDQTRAEITKDFQVGAHVPGDVIEIEVSTQTDPLPDDVDFELGVDENIDVSVASSLRDIVDEDSITKSHGKHVESPHVSRPSSKSEKSIKLSDPKISELTKTNIGRTSPTVILVERRVSSPTRINERNEILTEASLTVQHINIDESQISDVPPLPELKGTSGDTQRSKYNIARSPDDRALERISDANRDIQIDNLITQRLQVQSLDVSRLNVSELQASKILVSEVEGMTLQVNELDTKSGHISVSGIEFSQSIIDEIVKKFSEITTNHSSNALPRDVSDQPRPMSREEQTQTPIDSEVKVAESPLYQEDSPIHTSVRSDETRPLSQEPEHSTVESPPQRPPPPDWTPLLYSYIHDLSMPQTPFCTSRPLRDRPFTEFYEAQHQTPPAPNRRAKRRPTSKHSESSSEEERPRPSPRRMPPPVKAHEPTVIEAGTQFLRVCQSSISRTLRNIFNSFMSHISGTEDKKDVQMALVIFLVLIAGLIMFGLSDSRTVHHHHWEFLNPPDTKQ